ncbi:hypothetical protein ALT_6828 [Aspergillus lentulus]|uniref:Uncharacterized protein n=1 Tax=Aspergillus lentulus TaxID=293939 RepID=A0AAN4PNQ1_ASPLE|nr:hypothetical protein ALT_6828 [Aspergillus lentulus]
MLSHARVIFRKLRSRGSRSIRGSEPAPSAPATAAESETVDPSPRAIHISDVRQSPTNLPVRQSSTNLPREPGSTSMCIIVANAKGTADSMGLYRLLLREKGYGEYDPTDDYTTDYFCDGYLYNISFTSPRDLWWGGTAYLCLLQHLCLIFTYDASSRESWDEMVASCERWRSRCEEDGALPFSATMIAAMGEGEGEPAVSHAEAEAFATQRDCLFVKVSPTTGRGICDAVGSLVELAHGARDQYPIDQKDHTKRLNRLEALLCVAAIILLQPGLATNTNNQILFGAKGEAKAKKDSPGCKDVFFATMHVPRNTTGGEKSLAVIHRDGRLYAVKDKDPTQWAIQKNQNGRYFISNTHPSGAGHWWYRNGREIGVSPANWNAKEVSFAQAVESDTPFSKVTVFWDDLCLVVPDSESQPLMMLPQSACDPVILEISEPLQWKSPDEICKNEETLGKSDSV